MSEGFTERPENMEDGSVGNGKSWECSDPTRDNPGVCEMDPFTAVCRCDSWGQCERQPGNDGGKHWSFRETRKAAVGATSLSHSPIALLASRMDTAGLMVCRPQNKKDSVLFHHVWQRSQSLYDLQMPNSDLGDHKVYAFSDPKIHGAGDDTVSHKLQETLVWDVPEICSINAVGQKQCQLNREEVNASIARQRSPSWVLLEHADCSGNTNCEISAFDGDYTPQLVTDTLKTGSLERLDVHSCETDNWSLNHLVTDAHKTGSYDSLDVHSYETDNLNFDHLETDTHKTGFIDPLDVHSCEADNLNLDHLSLHVGRSGGQGKSTCVRSKEEDEKCSCPSEGFLGATCVDVTEVAPDYNTSDSCRESPTGNAMMLSSPQVNCAEMTYTGSSSEGSICDGLTYSAEYAADNDVACAIAVSAITSCSPESTNSTESLFDSLTEYDGAMISDNATDTTPCPAVAPRCSTGAESGSRADSIAENVCSPRSVGSSSGAVSCIESRFSTETEHCTSPMIICRNNMGNVVKRRPTSLQVTPVYVHKGLPTVEDSVPSELDPEDTSRQRHEMNKTSPVLRVSHCDDRSSTSGSQTCRANTNRYSWPASQSVQLRSRSCSRLRRKHVKSAIMTSTADSLGTVGLSRRFHSQQLPLTKSASFGHTLFQNVHWECPMTSARQVDSRKSEKFIMSLQKDGVIKPRLQQRCRHKRHSYHVTTGPCVTCTNHTNSLGPCFVLGIGQCHLCSDSSRNIAIKKNNDHPLVELEYVVPKSKNKTREAKTKAVEPMDMAVRNEMLQYTREKLGQRSKEDLVVLVEHFSRQARVVSEELVRLLQQKHDYIEQIEMRKVAIEQLLRLQMETK